MSLAARAGIREGRRLQVAGDCVSAQRGRVSDGEGKENQQRDETATGHGYAGRTRKGERTVRRSISCLLHAICSLVKRCVAFGIYRASSHLKLICLLAAGSCPRGVQPRGEPVTAHGSEGAGVGWRKEIVSGLSVQLPKARPDRALTVADPTSRCYSLYKAQV